MPVIDGIQSTRLIREFEHNLKPVTSPHVQAYGRIPIIAVSASISENNRQSYIDVGFDGWIVKPIDFQRLETVLAATEDVGVRRGMRYGMQKWEKGGWFGDGIVKNTGEVLPA